MRNAIGVRHGNQNLDDKVFDQFEAELAINQPQYLKLSYMRSQAIELSKSLQLTYYL